MSSVSSLPPITSQNTDNNNNDNSTNGGTSSGASSSLYLFTFLATLLLLLTVSCAIVVRSFIMRRRFRRRVEEALAAGVIISQDALHTAHSGVRRGGRYFGEKPKMWDINVVKNEDAAGDEKWDDIKPISARIVQFYNPHEEYMDGFQIDDSTNNAVDSRLGLVGRIFRNPFSRSSRRHSSDITASDPASSPSPSQSRSPSTRLPTSSLSNYTPAVPSSSNENANTTTATVQVSVLIAMPSPQNSIYSHNHNHNHHRHSGVHATTSSGMGNSLAGLEPGSVLRGTGISQATAMPTKGKARRLNGVTGVGMSTSTEERLGEVEIVEGEVQGEYEVEVNASMEEGIIETEDERGLLGIRGLGRREGEVFKEYDHEVPDIAIGIAQLPLRRTFTSLDSDAAEDKDKEML